MRSPTFALLVLAGALVAGCSSAPAPESPAPPAQDGPAPQRSVSATAGDQPGSIISGAADSVASIPGSANALYTYRFKQIDPPSDRFNFRDRELSFAFRPTPSALYFQVENLQGRPVWIDWDKSTFYDALGRRSKVAHSTTRWEERFRAQALTQIPPLGRISDYVFSVDALIDPAGTNEEQPRSPLLPEDQSAPTYTDRAFGVDLACTVEDRPRVYNFRFRVVSVIPR
jgi:hypothetical protein